MPLVTTARLVTDAVRQHSAVFAFNAITLEHAEAIRDGAHRAGRPAIIQISQNAVRYHGQLEPLAAACLALARSSDIPLALHLDHVTDHNLLYDSVAAGFSSVMFDAAALPYEQNVAATRAAADWARGLGIWVEAELGEIGGKGGAHTPGVRTDPAQAAHFVGATGVAGLAVAVGSEHAMTTRNATLDLDLIGRLRDAVPVPLVLHGSSGVAPADLVAAIHAGIVKVNVGTALNLAFTAAVQAELGDNPAHDPRRYLASAREAMADVVAGWLALLDR